MVGPNGESKSEGDPSGARGDAREAYELGDRRATEGDLSGAEEAYARADEAGHPTAATNLGMLRERRGDRKGAEEAYRRADERGDGLGAFQLGMLLAGREKWDEANDAWARAEERGTDAPGLDLRDTLRRRTRRERGPSREAAPRSAFANPVLIGAMAVLVLLVAVFLAYNANAGLPFVPTRQLKVDIADGSNLVIGNDVREGGFRIGLVSEMKPVELSNGTVGAQLTLQLDQSNGKVPMDSRVTILPRSVLGLKYVELDRGTDSRVFPDGGTVPIAQTTVPVQFDDIFKTFDKKTRGAIQQDLAGYGNTLAGRGSSLNDTIHSLSPLLLHLRPVAQYLSDPRTQLTRFFTSLNAFMGTVAPVAQTNARLFTDMATTFAAISRNPNDLEQTIAESPSTLSVSTDSLQVQQPFLVDLTTLGKNLTPATAELKAALPDINPAIEVGTRTLKRTPVLNAKLQEVMSESEGAGGGAGHERGPQRAAPDHAHAQPDDPLPGSLPDRVRLLELLVDLPGRAPVRADRVRVRAAGDAQLHRRQPARQRRLPRSARSRPPARPADPSSCTRRTTAPRSTRAATRTARPASAATRTSSTRSTRRAATWPSMRTPRVTRGRRSTAARASPPVRRSAATRRPAPSSPPIRAIPNRRQTAAASPEDQAL